MFKRRRFSAYNYSLLRKIEPCLLSRQLLESLEMQIWAREREVLSFKDTRMGVFSTSAGTGLGGGKKEICAVLIQSCPRQNAAVQVWMVDWIVDSFNRC